MKPAAVRRAGSVSGATTFIVSRKWRIRKRTPARLSLPRDPRAREVARALTANPADPRPLEAWGTQVGASARTLARLFVTETGLAFGQWREQARMRAAMPLLAEGLPLEAIAPRVGYASASSFVAAFHRVIGVTPRQYFPLHR